MRSSHHTPTTKMILVSIMYTPILSSIWWHFCFQRRPAAKSMEVEALFSLLTISVFWICYHSQFLNSGLMYIILSMRNARKTSTSVLRILSIFYFFCFFHLRWKKLEGLPSMSYSAKFFVLLFSLAGFPITIHVSFKKIQYKWNCLPVQYNYSGI